MSSIIPIKEIENLEGVKHNKTADGYTYEKDIYTTPEPIIIEIKKGNNEYITFTEKTTNITLTNNIPTNTYNLTITLHSGTNITLTTHNINEYQLIIYK